MHVDDLSDDERRLWMEFPFGTHIDLRSGDAERDDPAQVEHWSPERTIRAEVITALLVGRRPADVEHQEGAGTSSAVFLSGARIVGPLDLRGLDFEPPLLLQQCVLEQPLVIADSTTRSIRLYGCHLPGVEGAWLNCAGDLHLRDCTVTGSVDLEGAYVGGQLILSGSTLSNPGGVAVRADGLVVAGDLFCRDGALIDGEFRLLAARIRGEVRFTGSALHNPEGVALLADRLTVEKDMYCREGFEVTGEVRLFSAQVTGQLSFSHATLSNPGKVALCADQLVVGGHLYCQDRFSADGEIRLVAARVGGEVRFSASTLSNPTGTALCADRLVVAEDMYCRAGLVVHGMVSLRGAHISGLLNFNDATLSNPGQIGLNADQLVVGSHLYCHDGFAIEGGVSLVAARVGGEVRFNSAKLRHENGIALRADQLVVEADMYCRDKLEIYGEVSLRGTHVQGDLSFSTASVRNPGGVAIQATQLNVGDDFTCDESFAADGMIDLTDAHVAGELSFSGAKLDNSRYITILAPRLIVEKDMFCRDGFVSNGTVCLIGAHVGGKLSFTRGVLTGSCLTEQQLCDSGVEKMLTSYVKPEPEPPKEPPSQRLLVKWLHALRSRIVALLRAIGKLLCGTWHLIRRLWRPEPEPKSVPKKPSDAIVNGEFGLALVADGLSVELDMTCDAGFHAYGEIRLKGARIGRNLDFDDSEVNNHGGFALNAEDVQAERMLMPARCLAGWITLRNGKMVELDDKRGVRPDQIDILGLSYERLIPPLDPDTRLRWLAENDYEPQPYEQLAHSYRQLGYDESARKVKLAQERRRRETLTPARKVWGYLQDWTIGYGFLPARAMALFALVLVVGVVGFWIWPLPPLAADMRNPPQFNPFFYTMDVLIPFADFGQRELWDSTVGHEVFKVVLALVGWTLAITAIAGLNRALTRS